MGLAKELLILLKWVSFPTPATPNHSISVAEEGRGRGTFLNHAALAVQVLQMSRIKLRPELKRFETTPFLFPIP
jgi:hypothetical protein